MDEEGGPCANPFTSGVLSSLLIAAFGIEGARDCSIGADHIC